MKLKGEYKTPPTEKKCARCHEVKPCNIKFFIGKKIAQRAFQVGAWNVTGKQIGNIKMARETSIDVFNKIRSEGLLSVRRWQVYDILYNHGPATGNELLIHFRKKYGTLYGNSPVVTSRLGELRDLGVAVEKGTKICSITGQKVIEWDVTDQLPKEKKSKGEFCYFCEKCNQRFKEKPVFHGTKESSLFPCNGEFTRWKKIK